MKKLVLFGDSLFGQCGKHRLAMLETKLDHTYDVYNCAAGGWDSGDLVKKSAFIAKLNPEVLVLSVGTNDASPWKQIQLSEFEKNLQEVLKKFKDSKIVFFLTPPVDESKHTQDKMRLNEINKQYYAASKIICTEMGIVYIDSWKIFEPLLNSNTEYHVEDGVHLNDFAYDLVFDQISEKLQ